MRLAIITTHPIQYYAPVFKLLAERIDVKVFYTWGEKAGGKFDPGFGKVVGWDIPLTEGYNYEWVKNTAGDPGSHHFRGIINPSLKDQIKAFGAEAILVYGWAYHSHLKVIRYFKNKLPVYFRGDSTLLDSRRDIKSMLRYVLLKWVYSHIDHAFYVGTNNKTYFKRYGLKDSQLSFAPHAVDNDRFTTNRAGEAENLRQSLGIAQDSIVILFAGKFENKKSPQLLLEAFLDLNITDTHLLFVGNGILEITLKNMAGKHHKVHFLEFQNQSAMPVVYQACDLFCLPSYGPGETWGLAVNEAMAAGKPVIVSDKCGCAADLVIPGINGFIFEAGKQSSLAAGLQLLTADTAGLSVLGKNGGDKIAEWTFIQQVESFLATINPASHER